jgi:hypothetical protein
LLDSSEGREGRKKKERRREEERGGKESKGNAVGPMWLLVLSARYFPAAHSVLEYVMDATM